MIISASRRTDIPTYYSDWFFNRIKDGYVCVRNPMNIHQYERYCMLPLTSAEMLELAEQLAEIARRNNLVVSWNHVLKKNLEPFGIAHGHLTAICLSAYWDIGLI